MVSEILTVACITNLVFTDVTQCRVVARYQTKRPHIKGGSNIHLF